MVARVSRSPDCGPLGISCPCAGDMMRNRPASQDRYRAYAYPGRDAVLNRRTPEPHTAKGVRRFRQIVVNPRCCGRGYRTSTPQSLGFAPKPISKPSHLGRPERVRDPGSRVHLVDCDVKDYHTFTLANAVRGACGGCIIPRSPSCPARASAPAQVDRGAGRASAPLRCCATVEFSK